MKTLTTIPTEHQEAVCLVEWLEINQKLGNIVLFSHIPSETFTRSWGVKMRNKAEGVRKGVPDYVIITGGHVIFVELKRKKRSVVSPEQKQWIEEINKCSEVEAAICKGASDAIEFISEFFPVKKL